MEENKLQSNASEVSNELTPVTAPVKRTRSKPQPKQEAVAAAPIPMPAIIPDIKDDEQAFKLSEQETKKLKAQEARKALWREYQKESQMVTGVFRDLEVGAGSVVSINIKKYPWDQVEAYQFFDGQSHTIPLHVARHLNEDCRYPVYAHQVNPNAPTGSKVKQVIGQWNHRFAFISSDVIVRSTTPSIIGVQNTTQRF